jgi:stage V sporulation protein G
VLVKITSVNVRKIEKENSRMKGIVSILIDDCFAVHDIKVIEGDNGLFVAMPSRRNAVGDYRDVAHPINQETREMFNQVILEEYEKAEDPVVENEQIEEE